MEITFRGITPAASRNKVGKIVSSSKTLGNEMIDFQLFWLSAIDASITKCVYYVLPILSVYPSSPTAGIVFSVSDLLMFFVMWMLLPPFAHILIDNLPTSPGQPLVASLVFLNAIASTGLANTFLTLGCQIISTIRFTFSLRVKSRARQISLAIRTMLSFFHVHYSTPFSKAYRIIHSDQWGKAVMPTLNKQAKAVQLQRLSEWTS